MDSDATSLVKMRNGIMKVKCRGGVNGKIDLDQHIKTLPTRPIGQLKNKTKKH